MVKDGKPRGKVSRQPLTDQHIYALLVEVAPSESANHIDQMTETEFEYIADRGMVRVRSCPTWAADGHGGPHREFRGGGGPGGRRPHSGSAAAARQP